MRMEIGRLACKDFSPTHPERVTLNWKQVQVLMKEMKLNLDNLFMNLNKNCHGSISLVVAVAHTLITLKIFAKTSVLVESRTIIKKQ